MPPAKWQTNLPLIWKSAKLFFFRGIQQKFSDRIPRKSAEFRRIPRNFNSAEDGIFEDGIDRIPLPRKLKKEEFRGILCLFPLSGEFVSLLDSKFSVQDPR